MSKVSQDIIILIPVFNDWEAVTRVLVLLDEVLLAHGVLAHVLLVDDASTKAIDVAAIKKTYGQLRSIRVLRLRRNLGHQRAIAIGLAYIEANLSCRAVVIMDGDGEDDPVDVPRLLEKCAQAGDAKVIFAERVRRSESLRFKFFYAVYKGLHQILTGRRIRFGNFSVVPRERLTSLVVVSELWNHYAAAVVSSRQPLDTLPTRRGKRLAGQGSMDFIQLVTHGLSAISVYGDIVGVRLLVAAATSLALLVFLALTAAVAPLWAQLPVLVWSPGIFGTLVVLLLQAAMVAFLLSFSALSGRQRLSFLPIRDHPFFVQSISIQYQAPLGEQR